MDGRVVRGAVAPTTTTLAGAAVDDAGPLGAGVGLAVAGPGEPVAADAARAAGQAGAEAVQDAP